MTVIKLKFISNNVEGLQACRRQLQFFEYLRHKICSNGILFLQQTHSTFNNEAKWNHNFDGKIYYLNGISNSSGILIAFYGGKKINVLKDYHTKLVAF